MYSSFDPTIGSFAICILAPFFARQAIHIETTKKDWGQCFQTFETFHLTGLLVQNHSSIDLLFKYLAKIISCHVLGPKISCQMLIFYQVNVLLHNINKINWKINNHRSKTAIYPRKHSWGRKPSRTSLL